MKALTIRQPWAQLIVIGVKDVENRTWQTRHRGPLLIHAGLRVDREEEQWYRDLLADEELEWPNPLPTGAIVGAVQLVDCVTASDRDWFDGPYGWLLDKPLAFEASIPFRGRLGLFEVPDELIAEFKDDIADLWAHWDELKAENGDQEAT
jgi:hypothetical protein